LRISSYNDQADCRMASSSCREMSFSGIRLSSSLAQKRTLISIESDKRVAELTECRGEVDRTEGDGKIVTPPKVKIGVEIGKSLDIRCDNRR